MINNKEDNDNEDNDNKDNDNEHMQLNEIQWMCLIRKHEDVVDLCIIGVCLLVCA